MEGRLSDFASGGELKRQVADWERRYAELLQHVERLELRLSQAEKRAAQAEARVQQLQEELRGKKKDSGNSSKPPSSDIIKPPQKPVRGKRRRGGQEGHAPQQRAPFAPEQIDAVERHAYAACPQYGGAVEPLLQPAQVFHIDPTRSTAVLNQVLGKEFAGTLMADYYSAYRAYLTDHPRADAQFCLAHLIRDVKFLGESLEASDCQFAGALLVELKELFQLWHASRDAPEEAALRASLVAQGEQLERVATEQAPTTKLACNVARRFRKHARQYLRFTQVPGLEPTNNAAERAIRQVVIDRKVTQGTRSPRGRTWCQRIWTTIATCRQQNRDLLNFLQQSLLAHLGDTPPPSLLPPCSS